ncbi:MAG: LSM domain-containing protein [Methanocellales archaeon]
MQLKKKIQSPQKWLSASIGRNITVALKNGKEYMGELKGFDEHMNLVLEDVELLNSGRKLDTVVIRGDTIFYIILEMQHG